MNCLECGTRVYPPFVETSEIIWRIFGLVRKKYHRVFCNYRCLNKYLNKKFPGEQRCHQDVENLIRFRCRKEPISREFSDIVKKRRSLHD